MKLCTTSADIATLTVLEYGGRSYHDLPSPAPHRHRHPRVRKATASCFRYAIPDMLSLSSALDSDGQLRGINRAAGSPSLTFTHEYMFYLADQKFKINLCWTAC